jgi:hypothetical protein
MIGAGNATDFTEIFYSIDAGASWTSLDSPLTSLCCGGVACTGTLQGLWQENSYALPASCENITTLRIAFVWQNVDDGVATDPSFAVDDITITAPASSNTITTTNDFTPMSWCYGTSITGMVNFVSTGTYNPNNIYTAELSDAAGSFASATSIGTLTSSSAGSLSVPVTIAGTTPVGAGYRIRVVASDPSTTGTDNGADIEIFALPNVTFTTLADICVYDAAVTLTEGSPTGGTYSGPGVSGDSFDPATAGLGTHTLSYDYTDGNGCSNTEVQTILVDACISINEIENSQLKIYPNPTSESFKIIGAKNISSVRLLDLNGRVIKSFDEHKTSYDVSNLSTGVYLMKINSEKGETTLRLVVK